MLGRGTGEGRVEVLVRHVGMALIVTLIMLRATASWADMGFDEKYERDYNIFNPTNRYQPDNPLNPAQAYSPNNPFNPVNRYDPGNPANPINRFNPNNPSNPINRYRPENLLNPVNTYNPAVPFAPLDRTGRSR
jgi:hypothetical protein